MKKIITLVVAILIGNSIAFSQAEENYYDNLLATTFNAYNEVDVQLANHMYTFVKERFIAHLNDTTSFSNPHDSLSKYVSIRHTSDSLLKTYSWSERDHGCCHGTETYAQFKTPSGSVKYIDLDSRPEGHEEVFITDVQRIKIKGKSNYLILGNGTCCGGKHYSTARIFEIKNDTLVKSDNLFNGNHDALLYIGANRSQTIGLKYDAEKKLLSYNSYGELDDTGFYGDTKTVMHWKLSENGFNKE